MYVKGAWPGASPCVHLNQNGQTQANRLAQHLADVPVAAIYSSPLERTMETAQPIAEAHQLTVTPRPGLLEVDYGQWQDKTLKSLRRRKMWRTVQQAPSLARFPGGESFNEAQQRIVNEIESLCGLHKPKDIFICVGHSDMIKLAVAYFSGLPLDQFQRLMVQPASLSTLRIGEHGSQLVNLNLLPPKAQNEA